MRNSSKANANMRHKCTVLVKQAHHRCATQVYCTCKYKSTTDVKQESSCDKSPPQVRVKCERHGTCTVLQLSPPQIVFVLNSPAQAQAITLAIKQWQGTGTGAGQTRALALTKVKALTSSPERKKRSDHSFQRMACKFELAICDRVARECMAQEFCHFASRRYSCREQ